MFLLSSGAPAQEETLDEDPVEFTTGLPAVGQLAVSLSHEASRLDALLTMVVLDHLLADIPASGQLEASWLDERAWLDQLVERYTVLPLRSSAIDPVSWFVFQELLKFQNNSSSLVSPQGPDTTILIRQLFDRGSERLSAALLPEVLVRLESRSVRTWQDVLSRATEDDEWFALASRIGSGWSQSFIPMEHGAAGKVEG